MNSLHFVQKTQLASDIFQFDFEPTSPIAYAAGQFGEFYQRLPEGGTHSRWLSLSSSPTENVISFITRISANPSVYKNQLQHLQPGHSITMSAPMGDFVAPRDKKIPMIFIAAGIGINPVRSICRFLTDTAQSRKLFLFYIAKSENDFILLDELNPCASHIELTTRHPHSSKILQFYQQHKAVSQSYSPRIYISGPETIATAISHQLIQAGVDQLHIVTDYFSGYSSL